MQIIQWQTFSQQAVSRRVNCFNYTVYYETKSAYAEQDFILLNNIARALAWDKNEIDFKMVDNDFDSSELNTSGVTLWFGLQAAVEFGLVQYENIQQVGNIIFCPSPQVISKDVALKRQVWGMLKPLKN
jgi:hypothetical protein